MGRRDEDASLEKIAAAIGEHGGGICENSKWDRVFSYVVLTVATIVTSIIGYILWGLINTLTVSLESISTDLKHMRTEISYLTKHVKSMDKSMADMSKDMAIMSDKLSDMSVSVHNIDETTQDMQVDTSDMNKMNPMRKIF